MQVRLGGLLDRVAVRVQGRSVGYDGPDQQFGCETALFGHILADGGQRRSKPGRHRVVVEPHDGQVAGDVEAPILCREHHAVGDRVGEAQHRRDARVRVQQRAERGVTVLLGGVRLFDHHRLDPGGGQAFPPAEHPLDRHIGLRVGCFRRLQAVRPDDAGVDDADPSMAQRDEVLGRPPRPAAIVDVDAGHAGARLLIDEHQRQLPPLQPGQRRRGRIAVVHQRAVHRDVAGGHVSAGLFAGEQGERETRWRKPFDDRAEELGGHLVAERAADDRGEHDADGAGRATGQRSRRRIRADVAQFIRGGQDPVPQVGGQLIGTGKGVGNRHPADADLVGDRLQCHSRQGSSASFSGVRRHLVLAERTLPRKCLTGKAVAFYCSGTEVL